MQRGFDDRNAHRVDEKVIVCIVDGGRQIHFRHVRDDHLLQRMALVVVDLIVTIAASTVGLIGRSVFFDDSLIRVDQPHRNAGRYFADFFHFSADQEHACDATDVIQIARDIIVDKGCSAINADQIAICKSAKVGGIGVVVARFSFRYGETNVAHGGLQLIVGILVIHTKADLSVNGIDEHDASSSLIRDGNQPQILQVGVGSILIRKMLIGVDQYIRIHAVGRAHSVVHASRTINISRSLGIFVKRGICYVDSIGILGREICRSICVRFLQRFKCREVALVLLVVIH